MSLTGMLTENEDMNDQIKQGSYREHLFDKRWLIKKAGILERDGGRCAICGSTDHLVVHHKQYHMTSDGKKFLPWMYEDKYLVTLCEKCHRRGHAQYKVPVKIVNL